MDLQQGRRAVKLGFALDRGTETTLQFQIILGKHSPLKVFKTCFSLFVEREEKRFHEVRKAWWSEAMSGNNGSG